MGASFLVAEDSNAPSTSAPRRPPGACQSVLGHPASTQRVKNVFRLLAHRELCPRAKRSSKRFWRGSYVRQPDSNGARSKGIGDARCGLISWAEAESMQHMAAKDCPLFPPPRSTIAAAFGPDGKTLASTHGDHTVKIIDHRTGGSLKVLSGHRRTPWVVRFHPLNPEILASGSLDNEVRLWDANTGHCIGSYDFYRPIASIAFHAQGELLAVASGHKLYIWHYNRRGDTPLPTIVLKTRRSLRAVHFHPHAAPILLTAEVNELDASESEMTMATSPGYLRYPPPTVYLANSRNRDVGPSSALHSGVPSASVRLLTYSTPSRQYELLLSPAEPDDSSVVPEETQTNPNLSDMETANDTLNNMEVEPEEGSNQFFSFGDSWELPFLQGWLVGQTQTTQRTMSRDNGAAHGNSSAPSHNVNQSRVNQRTGSSAVASVNSIVSDANPQAIDSSRTQSELATSQAAAAASAELPCTVKLRIWSYNTKNPYAVLSSGRCRLTIPHAVLCSEMGTHFSPCGRFLAACVACTLHHWEADQSSVNHNVTGESTSPTRHPVFAHQVIYELRIYSVEEATFGKVLASRAIRAAHCLTSVQFSPTSEHLLLAYGRRHYSLLKSVAIDGERTVPTYTILEVYRVSDLELARVLSSKEDEVNVACFHPSVGGGLVYGTKEGKLRILQYDGPPAADDITSDLNDENMLQIPMNAPEC